MNRISSILSFFFCIAAHAAEPPNVVLILADDPGEECDRSAESPELRTRLSEQLEQWSRKVEQDRTAPRP